MAPCGIAPVVAKIYPRTVCTSSVIAEVVRGAAASGGSRAGASCLSFLGLGFFSLSKIDDSALPRPQPFFWRSTLGFIPAKGMRSNTQKSKGHLMKCTTRINKIRR